MAETIETTINRVFDPEPGSRQPWAALAEDGKRYVTFDPELGPTIRQYEGKRGKLSFGVQEKNGYMNYYFNGFEPMETLDEELTNRANGAAPNYRQPTHPRDQASMRRALALQRANEMLAYLPEDERTMSSVNALFKQYLEILEGE